MTYGLSIKSALIPIGPSSSWTQGEPGAESRISGVFRGSGQLRLAIISFGGERRIREPQMAEETKPAAKAAKAPTSADIERAREFAREPFLLEGEKPRDLAPGTPRRRALDAALAEIDEGREAPSIEWRRDFSLMLGLERLLSEDKPHLADGAELDPHQVDALSGTLAAMIADIQERLNGHPWTGNGNGDASAAATQGRRLGERRRRRPRRGGDRGTTRRRRRKRRRPPRRRRPRTGSRRRTRTSSRRPPRIPGADRRFWFEHATGAGKTVAAVGFIEASRTGGILILTHRRNLVDQFIGEISDRGYADRLSPPLLDGADHPYGPVTVETYQWFVRNAGRISDAYSIVICDEAHTALGEKTSGCIRAWIGPVFIGMTATGALIARHVADLFPTQTSRFDLAQAARRGVIAPLRCVRIPPGPGRADDRQGPAAQGRGGPGLRPGGARQAARPGAVQRRDRRPLPLALPARSRRRLHRRRQARQERRQGLPGRRHQRPRRLRRDAEARAGRDPRRLRARRGRRALQRDAARRGLELAARDDLHAPGADRLAARLPAARRPRHPPQPRQGGRPGDRPRPPGDHPRRDDRHPPQPARPRRLPRRRDRRRPGAAAAAAAGSASRSAWSRSPPSPSAACACSSASSGGSRSRTSTHSEQHVWAALAGARVNPSGWRRAKAMLQHDQTKELRRRFLLTCVQRNRNQQLRLKALAEIAALRDAEAFDDAIDTIGTWPRDDRRAGTKVLLAGARRAADRPPRPGPGLGLAPRRLHARPARGVRGPALARDQAPARPARQLIGPRPRPQRPPAGPRRTQPGPPPGRRAARRRASPTRPRARRSCAARGCGWPASPPPSPASCFATSRRPAASAAAASARAALRAAPPRRTAPQRRPTASS